MALPSIVLVDRSRPPSSAALLARVGEALQTQVDRDFGTVWGASAKVRTASGSAGLSGAWTISVVDDPQAVPGIDQDLDGTPCAAIRAGEGWTLAASHVLLEMLANPAGDRFMEGPGVRRSSQVRSMRYLVEVCDPCQLLSYEIDGIEVSDFVTPDYYRVDAPAGTALDFLRKLRRPLEVPPGGCLSWQDPTDRLWHQVRPGGRHSRSDRPFDLHLSPRRDRDLAFPGDASRHDLTALRQAHRQARSRVRGRHGSRC